MNQDDTFKALKRKSFIELQNSLKYEFYHGDLSEEKWRRMIHEAGWTVEEYKKK